MAAFASVVSSAVASARGGPCPASGWNNPDAAAVAPGMETTKSKARPSRSQADHEGVKDQFLDYLDALARDEAEGGLRAQAIRTLAEVYAAPPYTPISAGRRITAAALGALVGLAVGVLVGLALL